jgi:uncharacterized protein
MDRRVYETIESYMLACMKDSAHDKEHVYRVLYVAVDIAATEENIDRNVLVASCLLHDIGREAQYRDPGVCHAEEGSKMAYDFLLKNGWAPQKAAHVRSCILTHRYRSDRPPQSIEAKILFDADKIDAAGALGIARTLIYQGQVSQPLYTVDGEGNVMDGAGEEPPSFFREYRFKLEKVYGSFYTSRGQAIARERRAAAGSFYDAILREANDCYVNGKRDLNDILK